MEEYPFIFTNTPPSLLILASTEVALELWRYRYSKSSDNLTFSAFTEQKFSCEEMLDLPRGIRAEMNRKINAIRKELKNCVAFHYSPAFSDAICRQSISKCLKHMVASSSGTINFKATALNILNSGDLGDVENYKIACIYCLEDQVRRFWPSVLENLRPPENGAFAERCLVLYWNRRVTQSRENMLTEAVSVTERRLDHARIDCNWPAFDYFWDILPDKRKLLQATTFLRSGYRQAAARILRKLNRVDAEVVFEEGADQVLHILVTNEMYFRYVPKVWDEMGHGVRENKNTFLHVVRILWNLVFDTEVGLGLNNTRCDQINDLLLKIWSNTSDELKLHVSMYIYMFFIVSNVNRSDFSCYYGHNMTFMLELLRIRRKLNRGNFWLRNWQKLALRAKPRCLEQFMRLCLPNDGAVELFKEQLLGYRLPFELLIEHGFYSDLREYVGFCTRDAAHFQRVSQRMLRLNSHVIMLHDDDKFAEFERFVDEIFLNAEDEGVEKENFKARMISTAKCLKYLLDTWFNEGRLSGFTRIISRFVTPEGKLEWLKRKLSKYYRRNLVSYQSAKFNADRCRELLENFSLSLSDR